jgi:hypothetical protein
MTSLQCAVKSSARIYGLKIRTNSRVSFYFLLFNYKLQAVLLVYHTMHKGEFEILPNGSVLILFFSFYVLFRLFALPYPLLALLCLPVLCCTCLHSLIYISHVTTLFTVADDSSLRQAKDVETKRIKAGSSRQGSSLTWRQVMRLLLKTTVERSKPLCLYARQERSCHTGE